MKKTLFFILALLAMTQPARAAVVGEIVEYRDGNTPLEGYIAYDDAVSEARPGILVVHEWKGLGDYAKRRARELAAMGYVALAVDMYGKGIRPESHEEAAKQAGIYKNDRQLMRSRVLVALDLLKKHPLTNPDKLAAVGYCFGGTTVLELARSGADVKGVASFHGALSTPNLADAKNIKGKVLVCHGADDKFVPAEEVETFKKEMSDAGVDMRFHAYPGAVHSFTVSDAGDDPTKGMAYNEAADKASWGELKAFLDEIFK